MEIAEVAAAFWALEVDAAVAELEAPEHKTVAAVEVAGAGAWAFPVQVVAEVQMQSSVVQAISMELFVRASWLLPHLGSSSCE